MLSVPDDDGGDEGLFKITIWSYNIFYYCQTPTPDSVEPTFKHSMGIQSDALVK